MAYEFFHSKEEINNYFKRNDTTKELFNKIENINFNFDKYSYCVVYGFEVEKMYYSYQDIYFNDLSPKYARPSNKILVSIKYRDQFKNKVIFYKLNKNPKLRGFYGI
jgi:hypothetical protein